MTRAAARAAAAGLGRTAAVIDVGSNSVLLLVVVVGPDGRARAVDEAVLTTRLGEALAPGGALTPAGRARTQEAVVRCAVRARAAGATALWLFATGAVRDAADGPGYASELAVAADAPMEVLDGAREARLAWAAVAHGLGVGDESLLVTDVGGRTTEIARGRGTRVERLASLPLGALSLTESHLGADPPDPAALAHAAAAVDAALAAAAPVLEGDRPTRFAASGGTATALAALDLGLPAYAPWRMHGHTLARATLDALLARLVAVPAAARTALGALDPGRAAVLPAGTLVLARLLAAAGCSTLTVSDHGVRHAYLREQLAGAGITANLQALWG